MNKRDSKSGGWRLLAIAAAVAFLLGGCRDRAEYEPPGYAPPPPPPPTARANVPAAPMPLEKVDPLTLSPKLTDPEDAKGKVADLKRNYQCQNQ